MAKVMKTEYNDLCRVTISKANNGYTISKYTEYGESMEVATSWEKAVESAKKMMGTKGKANAKA